MKAPVLHPLSIIPTPWELEDTEARLEQLRPQRDQWWSQARAGCTASPGPLPHARERPASLDLVRPTALSFRSVMRAGPLAWVSVREHALPGAGERLAAEPHRLPGHLEGTLTDPPSVALSGKLPIRGLSGLHQQVLTEPWAQALSRHVL